MPANPGESPGFVGGLSPCEFIPNDRAGSLGSAWDAPFLPETRFFDYDYQRKTIKIRYDKMLAEDIAFYDRYYDAAAVVAAQTKTEAPEFGEMPKYAITAILDKPPRSPRIATSLIAGDPWILGQSTEVNEELALLLGMNRGGWRAQIARERYGLTSPTITPNVTFAPQVKAQPKAEPVIEVITPKLTPDAVLGMSQEALAKFILNVMETRDAAKEAAKAKKPGNNMAAARAAKDAKRALATAGAA